MVDWLAMWKGSDAPCPAARTDAKACTVSHYAPDTLIYFFHFEQV